MVTTAEVQLPHGRLVVVHDADGPGASRAAEAGRDARARYAATEVFDEKQFTPADWATLSGTWIALGRDAGQAGAAGPDGLIDDDVALVKRWGFNVSDIAVPVLLV